MRDLTVDLVEMFARLDQRDKLFILPVEIRALTRRNFTQTIIDRSDLELRLDGSERVTGYFLSVRNLFEGVNVSRYERLTLSLEQVEQIARACMQVGKFLA